MRTTIWVPDDVIKDMKEAAWRKRLSLSRYLVGLHVGDVVEKVAPAVKVDVGFYPQPKGGKK